MTLDDAPVTLSWDGFVAALTALVPTVAGRLTADSRLDTLLAGDRIEKGMLSAALRHLLGNPPDELLQSIETVGEAFEWSLTRQSEEQHRELTSITEALRRMQTSRIRLRPIIDSDLPLLYGAAVDPRWSFRYRYHGSTPSPPVFATELFAGVLTQFGVERLTDRRLVGTVSCYNARLDQGWAYIAFTRVSAPLDHADSDMLEGGFLFIAFLFRTWPLRKLYAEVSGWNWEQFARGAGTVFENEGMFREHEFFEGRFWDQHIVSIARERWDSLVPLFETLYTTHEQSPD